MLRNYRGLKALEAMTPTDGLTGLPILFGLWHAFPYEAKTRINIGDFAPAGELSTKPSARQVRVNRLAWVRALQGLPIFA